MTQRPAFPDPGHNHAACVAAALERAEEMCRARGRRLTPRRRQVLEIVWSGHAPLGAYDVLDALAADGAPAAPMTVYRALDFLVAEGLVHKLSSLNAYVGCPGADHSKGVQFLICRRCHTVAEVDGGAVAEAVEEASRSAGFQAEVPSVEIAGLCARCRP